MIRIWNYNKSRIHSYRGARYIEVTLDDMFIFKGEIRRAQGYILEEDTSNECILFTTSTTILGLIEKYEPIHKKRQTQPIEINDRGSRPNSNSNSYLSLFS